MSFALALSGHLAFVLCLLVVAFVVGRRLAGARDFDSPAEELALSTTLGLGALALALFLLGLAGLFARLPIALTVAVGLAASRRSFVRLARLAALVRSRRALAVVAAVLVAAVPVWLLALYPPADFDATSYHLPLARAAVERGAWRATPYLRYPAFPPLGEVLFACGILVGDELDAHAVSFVCLLVGALLLYAAARHLGGPRAGLFAAALFAGSPGLLLLGTTGYVDLVVGLFATAAFWALLRAVERGAHGWFALAGAFAGFAAMAKYSGLFVVVTVAAVALVRAQRRVAFTTIALAAAIVLPTHAFIAVSTGNPVHPFFGAWLGLGPWSPADLAGQMDDLSHIGTPRTVAALVRLPYDLAFHQERFRTPGLMTPLLGVAAVASLLVAVRDRRVRRLVVLALAFTLFWFATVRGYRYLIPAVALVCIGGAVAAARASSSLSRWPRAFVTVAVLVALVAPSAWWVSRELRFRGAPRLDAAARDAYLAPRLPAYRAMRFAAALADRDGTALYQLRLEQYTLYGGSRVRGDWFGPARYDDVTRLFASPRALHAHLRGMGVGWLVAPVNVELPTENPEFQRLFGRRYRDRAAAVYALLPDAP